MTSKRVLVLVGAAVVMISGSGFAQDAPGRELQKTNLRAFTPIFSGSVTFGTSFVHLLTPTAITCPGSSTCTLHIEVSSEINSLDAGAQARMRLLVDGSVASPGIAYVRVATNNGAAPSGVIGTSFQWLKIGVTPGLHTVEWLAATSSGTAVAINRIQKINIYTP
ncbi:MAG TPA: hypothetical protein VGF24_13540 [Vicinamibacterales bacterium]|jgi:hypothetical protein